MNGLSVCVYGCCCFCFLLLLFNTLMQNLYCTQCQWHVLPLKLQLPLNSNSSRSPSPFFCVVVWATLSAIDSLLCGCCAWFSAPANSDRLLSFQFMLCLSLSVCVCTWIAWVRTCSFHVPHRFCVSVLSFFSLALALALFFFHFCINAFTIRRYSVVLTSLLHLHHNNSIFSVHSKIHSRYANGYWQYSIMYTISNSVV